MDFLKNDVIKWNSHNIFNFFHDDNIYSICGGEGFIVDFLKF